MPLLKYSRRRSPRSPRARAWRIRTTMRSTPPTASRRPSRTCPNFATSATWPRRTSSASLLPHPWEMHAPTAHEHLPLCRYARTAAPHCFSPSHLAEAHSRGQLPRIARSLGSAKVSIHVAFREYSCTPARSCPPCGTHTHTHTHSTVSCNPTLLTVVHCVVAAPRQLRRVELLLRQRHGARLPHPGGH